MKETNVAASATPGVPDAPSVSGTPDAPTPAAAQAAATVQAFPVLQQATEFLHWSRDQQTLLQMQRVYDEGAYFVVFTGQYSAGKSCLINSLLGRPLLPQGITETTPLLTYIRYGERECAKLVLQGREEKEIPLEQVRDIRQHADSLAFSFDELEYIEIFLPEPMLRNGMILLDTPGINTLIARHEQLLDISLALASQVVYVTSNAPSAVDTDKIRMMVQAGIDILFVRTHCDMAKRSEETYEELIDKDRRVLAGCGLSSDVCFHVSNEKQSWWFPYIDNVKAKLAQKGRMAQEELRQSTERQLSALAKRCLAALEEERTALQEVCNRDKTAQDQRIKRLEKQITALDTTIQRRRQTLQTQVQDSQRKLNGAVRSQIGTVLKQSRDRIQKSDICPDAPEQTQSVIRDEARRVAKAVYTLIHEEIDPILLQINGELILDFPELADTMPVDSLPQVESTIELIRNPDPEFDSNPGPNPSGDARLSPNMHIQTLSAQREIESIGRKMLALQQRQQDIESQLNRLEGASAIQNDLQQLEREISELQQQKDNLPPYIPQLIEVPDGEVQPSQVMKTIGNIADWLTLLLPGEALLKLPGLNWLTKTAKQTETAKKVLNTGDSVRDITLVLQKIQKERKAQKTSQQSSSGSSGSSDPSSSSPLGSLLNFFSIEHLAESVGKIFDRPPRFVPDLEYEREYFQAKHTLENELRQRQAALVQQKIAFGVFQSETERLEAERQAAIVDQQKLAAALDAQKAKIQATARQAALVQWRQDCASRFCEQVQQQIQQTLRVYNDRLPEQLEQYQDQQIQVIYTQLHELREHYQQMLHAEPGETEQKLQTVLQLIRSVRGCVHE